MQKCEAAGGGTSGAGACFARTWFENAYSSFAYDANGSGDWGVSRADTSAGADSLALSECVQAGGTACEIPANGRDRTANPTSPNGGLVEPRPSYGVWAISPSVRIAAFGVGDSVAAAEQVAAGACVAAHGLLLECSVYGGWVENAYSSIYVAGNGRWAISFADSPKSAESAGLAECEAKAAGTPCTIVGQGSTLDPWAAGANKAAWIREPMPPEQPTQHGTTGVVCDSSGACWVALSHELTQSFISALSGVPGLSTSLTETCISGFAGVALVNLPVGLAGIQICDVIGPLLLLKSAVVNPALAAEDHGDGVLIRLSQGFCLGVSTPITPQSPNVLPQRLATTGDLEWCADLTNVVKSLTFSLDSLTQALKRNWHRVGKAGQWLQVRAKAPESGTWVAQVEAVVGAGKASAARILLLGRGSTSFRKAGSRKVSLKLTQAGRRLLRRPLRRLRVTVTVDFRPTRTHRMSSRTQTLMLKR